RKTSERTSAALAAASARGRRLGWANPSRKEEQQLASRQGAVAAAHLADQFASNVLPIVASLRATGIETLSAIATALNARGIRTARGGNWYATTVRNLLARAPAPITLSV